MNGFIHKINIDFIPRLPIAKLIPVTFTTFKADVKAGAFQSSIQVTTPKSIYKNHILETKMEHSFQFWKIDNER